MRDSTGSEKRILEKAEQLFLQYGIRSVTMDDISKELSMSKKTIYQHFKDKDAIVLEVTKRVFSAQKQIMNHIHQRGESVIQEMVLLSNYLREHIASVNPTAMYDLQKFYKEAWNVFRAFQQECLVQIEDVINRGIQEGCFRPDIDARIVAILRAETISLSFDQQLFPRERFAPREVQIQLFEQFINGILTDQGRALYQQYSNKEVSL